MSIRTEKVEASKLKLEEVKRAMQNKREVYYNGKPYLVEAIRMCYSVVFKGIVYQAELIDTVPKNWNSVIVVALEKICTDF